MDRMIYLSMSGAKATMQRQDVLANNLANVSTTGFRGELAAFRSVPVLGDGASTRVYSLETTPGYNNESGPVLTTGNPLDVATKGNAWLAVQGLDGTEGYTKAGHFEVTSDGTLVTPTGLPVLGEGGPIAIPPNSTVSIGGDGTISAIGVTGKNTPVGKLKLVTPETPFIRSADGLFRSADGADLSSDPTARVQDGALEGSNVSPVETMVQMISAARQFESQMKLLTTAQQNDEQATKLLSTT